MSSRCRRSSPRRPTRKQRASGTTRRPRASRSPPTGSPCSASSKDRCSRTGRCRPETGTLTRIVQFDLDGNVIAQYAYELDPLQAEPAGPDADFADNGAAEILAVDDSTFLLIERSGIPQAEGPWKMYIRIYAVDISGSTDISDVSSLAEATDVVPATKTLVVDFEDLDLEHVDNVEGLTWGPDLPNGSRSIVAVSDNNFDEASVTQFFVFDSGPA